MYKLMVEFHNFWPSLGQIPTDRKISPINCVVYMYMYILQVKIIQLYLGEDFLIYSFRLILNFLCLLSLIHE